MFVERTDAAILCAHVASGKSPILLASRTEPEMKEDSGWQFVCSCNSEDWSSAEVWRISEVLEKEPSLAPFINMPIGTALTRKSVKDEWNQS